MKNMNINGKTKVTDIMAQYPWLLDELIKVNSKFKMANTPIGRMMLKNATVADVSKKSGVDQDTILRELKKYIEAHEAK